MTALELLKVTKNLQADVQISEYVDLFSKSGHDNRKGVKKRRSVCRHPRQPLNRNMKSREDRTKEKKRKKETELDLGEDSSSHASVGYVTCGGGGRRFRVESEKGDRSAQVSFLPSRVHVQRRRIIGHPLVQIPRYFSDG